MGCSKHFSNNILDRLTTATMNSTTTAQTSVIPKECLAAVSFTEKWRADKNGSDFRPGGPHSEDGYTCDLHKSSQWFRFSGAAGSQMLSSCPEVNSCGTNFPLWTDATMPQKVGVSKSITAYSVQENGYCQEWTVRTLVMRCSWDTDHDFIYRPAIKLNRSCREAYCGMM